MAAVEQLNPHLVDKGPIDFLAFVGGNGGSHLLPGLRRLFPNARIAACVTTGDFGGSTGWFRRQYPNFAAVGDLGAVGAATAKDPIMRKVLEYRFGKKGAPMSVGGLGQLALSRIPESDARRAWAKQVFHETTKLSVEMGEVDSHTYRNMVYTALQKRHNGDIVLATRDFQRLADSQVILYPASCDTYHIKLTDHSHGKSEEITGEDLIDKYTIDEPDRATISLVTASGEPPRANPQVLNAIQRTRGVILRGAGSPGTSIVPSAGLDGMAGEFEAFKDHDGWIVDVANLVAGDDMPGLTVPKLVRFIGRHAAMPTHVLYNTDTKGLPAGSVPLVYEPEIESLEGVFAYGARLVSAEEAERDPNDPLADHRSGVYHDVGALILEMWNRGLTGGLEPDWSVLNHQAA